MTMTHLILDGLRPLFLAAGAVLLGYLSGLTSSGLERVIHMTLAMAVALMAVIFAAGYGIDLKGIAGCR